MAYYLQFDGVNDYVSLPVSVAIPAASNGSVIFTAESPADSEVYGMFGGIGERFTIRSSDIFFRLNSVNGNTITHATIRTFLPTYDRANKHTYELRKILYIDGVRTQVHLYIDGVYCGLLISHYGSTGPDIKFNSIGVASTNYARMNLYSFDIVVNGVYTVRYDPSIVLADPNILVDEIGGNNGTLINFPTDGSARVPYDDGGGGEEQITSSGGIASALAGGAASAQIIHEQVVSASGIAVAVASGVASISVVNEQVNSTGGITSTVASASTSTSVINEQVYSSGGIASAIAGATASIQVINEQTSEQVVSSGGISASIGSASASTQVIHEQVISSGGVAVSLAGTMASSTVIENYAIVQVVQSGGISSAYMSGIASTSQVVEQIVSSGGVAAAVMTGSASTIVKELSGDWSAPEILFSEAQPIEQISLTFGQLGRPLVFYRVGENTLKLYWYDPVAQQNVTTTLTTGKDPTACFDFPQDTGQSFTDALLFYVRDDQVFMRIQRDRYAIEYPCPALRPGLRIKSAGLRIDNRLQVEYEFKDAGYVPPVVPVLPVVIEGDWRYRLSGWSSGIETPWRVAGTIGDTEFEVGLLVTSFSNLREYLYASGTSANVAPHTLFAITAGVQSNGLKSEAGFAELAVETTAAKRTLLLRYQQYPQILLNLSVGFGDFDFSRYRFVFGPKSLANPTVRSLKIYGTFRRFGQLQDPAFDDVQIYSGEIPVGVSVYDLHQVNPNSRLYFGVLPRQRPNSTWYYSKCLSGTISQCYAIDGRGLVSWLMNTRGQSAQPSDPTGSDAQIINHNAANWIFFNP